MIPARLRRVFFPVVRNLLALAVLAWSALPARAQLQSGDLVAICGDSITQQKIYSVYMEAYLLACQPAADLQAMQFGWGGERAPGFDARYANDVEPFKPQVATTCYGMNDGGYNEVNDKTLETYRNAMTSIVQKMKASGVRFIVVGSPGIVDELSYKGKRTSAEVYNHTLEQLARTAEAVAKEQGVTFADVNKVMMDATTAYQAREAKDQDKPIAGDGVHPNPSGQLAMAYAFLKALGCPGDIGTITMDMKAKSVTTDAGQKITGNNAGALEIESTRYPFCFLDAPAAAMAGFLPFNQNLNRYMLVVKNAPAKAKVTWGETSREYTRAELAKGVNLAADFTPNPFTEPFRQVTGAVFKQQDFETAAIKGPLNSMIAWQKMFPKETSVVETVRKTVVARDAELRAASRQPVKPVRHTLKVEPAA